MVVNPPLVAIALRLTGTCATFQHLTGDAKVTKDTFLFYSLFTAYNFITRKISFGFADSKASIIFLQFSMLLILGA